MVTCAIHAYKHTRTRIHIDISLLYCVCVCRRLRFKLTHDYGCIVVYACSTCIFTKPFFFSFILFFPFFPCYALNCLLLWWELYFLQTHHLSLSPPPPSSVHFGCCCFIVVVVVIIEIYFSFHSFLLQNILSLYYVNMTFSFDSLSSHCKHWALFLVLFILNRKWGNNNNNHKI